MEHTSTRSSRGRRLSVRPDSLRRVRAAALALVALAPFAVAQDPPTAQGVTVQVDGDFISISVNESTGLPISEFVKLAEQVTGRVFTFSETEFQSSPNANVTFVGTVRIRRENFFSFFQTMLYIENFACVLRGHEDTEIVEIVNMTGPKRNEINASARYVPPEEIDNYANQTGVTILTSVPLQHINANTATTALRPFFSTASTPGGGLVPGNVGNGRAMLLQGFGPQVYAAYQLLRLVDVPPEVPDQEMRVYRLENATAEELEPILKQVMDERGRRTQQGAGVSGGDLTTGQASTVNILAHGSLNALILSGTRDRVAESLDLIARLDVPLEDTEGNLHVIQLKNVLAEDLRETLRNFLQEDQQAQQQAQAGATQAGNRLRRTVVVDHKESNSLLISATQSKFRQVERMITELDRRQPQVLIEAALVELSTDDLSRIGVELGALDIGADDFVRPFGFTSFGLSTFSDTDDDGLPDTRLPDFDNPLQGVTGGIISSDDFAIPLLVNALANDSQANILSLPSVVVNNNEEASVTSTEERPTLSTNQGTATTQQGFEGFQGAGIELSISPSISSEDYLRLNITLTVSRFLTPFDPNSATPGVKATRTVSTAVTLPSGHTMIVGGVIEDSESYEESGIPFLKDIPILGFLFSTYSESTTKRNLYFFVTPTILDEEDFSHLSEVSFRKKLEAADYIGNRRLQIVDRRWRQNAQTLEDSGANIEDFDRRGGFDIPYRLRPTSEPRIEGTNPSLPQAPVENGSTTGNGAAPETSTNTGNGDENR